MTTWPQAEYINANRARLETIRQGVEACFGADTDLEFFRVSIVPGGVPPAIAEASPPADELMEDEPTLLPAQAAQRASTYNASLVGHATTHKDTLLTWATTKARGDRSQLMRQLLIGETPPELLEYGAAQWRKTDYEWQSNAPDSYRVEVRVASLVLSKLDVWGSAQEHLICIRDDELDTYLSLRYLTDKLRDVTFSVSARGPDVVSKLVDAFGRDTNQLMVWVVGAFKDEAELDAGLAAFADAHPQVPAHELHKLIAEVRAHGIAANKAMAIETSDLLLPDIERLDEFIKVLG